MELAPQSQHSKTAELRLESISASLFYIAFAVFFFSNLLVRTTISSIFESPTEDIKHILDYVVIILLGAKTFTQRASLKQWAIAISLVVTFFYVWKTSDEGWLYWVALFVVAGQNIKLETLAKIVFYEGSTLFLVIILSYKLGFIEDFILYRGSEIRQSFGFSHPNFFGLYSLLISFSFSIFNFGRHYLLQYSLTAVIIYLNITITDSRSVAMLGAIQIAMIAIFKYAKSEKSQHIWRLLFATSAALVPAISLYLMMKASLTDPAVHFLDKTLSWRITLAQRYYEMAGLRLFGNTFESYPPIFWINGEPRAFGVDMSSLHVILRFGLVAFIIFIYAYFALLVRIVKDRHWDILLFGFTLMSLYGFTETIAIRIDSNFILVALAPLVLYRGSCRLPTITSIYSDPYPTKADRDKYRINHTLPLSTKSAKEF